MEPGIPNVQEDLVEWVNKLHVERSNAFLTLLCDLGVKCVEHLQDLDVESDIKEHPLKIMEMRRFKRVLKQLYQQNGWPSHPITYASRPTSKMAAATPSTSTPKMDPALVQWVAPLRARREKDLLMFLGDLGVKCLEDIHYINPEVNFEKAPLTAVEKGKLKQMVRDWKEQTRQKKPQMSAGERQRRYREKLKTDPGHKEASERIKAYDRERKRKQAEERNNEKKPKMAVTATVTTTPSTSRDQAANPPGCRPIAPAPAPVVISRTIQTSQDVTSQQAGHLDSVTALMELSRPPVLPYRQNNIKIGPSRPRTLAPTITSPSHHQLPLLAVLPIPQSDPQGKATTASASCTCTAPTPILQFPARPVYVNIRGGGDSTRHIPRFLIQPPTSAGSSAQERICISVKGEGDPTQSAARMLNVSPGRPSVPKTIIPLSALPPRIQPVDLSKSGQSALCSSASSAKNIGSNSMASPGYDKPSLPVSPSNKVPNSMDTRNVQALDDPAITSVSSTTLRRWSLPGPSGTNLHSASSVSLTRRSLSEVQITNASTSSPTSVPVAGPSGSSLLNAPASSPPRDPVFRIPTALPPRSRLSPKGHRLSTSATKYVSRRPAMSASTAAMPTRASTAGTNVRKAFMSKTATHTTTRSHSRIRSADQQPRDSLDREDHSSDSEDSGDDQGKLVINIVT